LDCNQAFVGKRFNIFALNAEMIGPPVPPGMEQPNDLPRKGMNRGDIASFVAIANHAGQRQIVCAGRNRRVSG